ncbi:hypothetical protein CK227_30855 [Mesorhizobium sp. WSM4308]|uniref:hypothetical protein n=1 Tax=Mesorhizobium sp. WSM4308 TaxID=2029409 RepID=UPI000BAEE225|nr:hypothetical protein [Mesorhizobium sp. WSM4308]PBB71755.1 hypothetical protein CK227_30855 [Mesorhizobium sp. WSM4308]
MHGSITARCRRLTLVSAAALALTIVPYRIALHGSAPGIEAASAQASGGGGGGGGGGSGGNSAGGNSGNSGSSDNGNANGGNSATEGNGDNSASGKGQSTKDVGHVNGTTGDKVEVSGSKITVTHPDGITEKIENGRFRMKDALGRTIIDRRATPADVSRLKAL